MLLCLILVYWCTWNDGISSADVLRLPNKVLEEIAIVLGKQKVLGLFDDIAEVRNKLLTFR